MRRAVEAIALTVGTMARVRNRQVAQRFATGGGGPIHSVGIKIKPDSSANGSDFEAAIHSDSSGQPGTRLYKLRNPSGDWEQDGQIGVRTFRAPADAELNADTDYWLVLKNGSRKSSDFFVNASVTPSTGETTSTDWRIANRAHERAGTSGPWSARSNVLQMTVRASRTVHVPGPSGPKLNRRARRRTGQGHRPRLKSGPGTHARTSTYARPAAKESTSRPSPSSVTT